jgi:GTPase SAR1 family protein
LFVGGGRDDWRTLQVVLFYEIKRVKRTVNPNSKTHDSLILAVWLLSDNDWLYCTQGRYRNLWSYYFRQCSAIVFVVDGADRQRLPVARTELDALLANRKLNGRRTRVPVLIFANKSDKRESLDDTTLSHYFRLLDRAVNRPLKVMKGSATGNVGLRQGVEWTMREVMKCRQSPEQQESSNFVSWF